MKKDIESFRSALAVAASVLADADARLRAANAPESDASPEDYAAIQTARETAKRDFDAAESDLSSALTAQRKEYEIDCLFLALVDHSDHAH